MNIRAKIYGDWVEEPLLKAKKPRGAKADELDSIPVPRESRQRSDSRAEDRHRLLNERARVTHDGAHHEVELINLSGGGAMISGALKPLLWDRLDLHLGTHGDMECAVRWIRDGRIGLEFAHETRLDWSADVLHSLDLEYHNVNPATSLYQGIVDAGQTHRVLTDEQIEAAITTAPANTRAHGRGEVIRRLIESRARRYVIDWDSIYLDRDRYLELKNPYHDYHKEAHRFMNKMGA